MSEKENLLQETLYKLGITRKLKSYEVMFSAVLKVIDNPDKLFGVTKDLYIDLAKSTNSSLTRIEKSLRGATEKAWTYNPEYLKKITHLDLTKRPSSTEFIDMIAVYIERTSSETKKAAK